MVRLRLPTYPEIYFAQCEYTLRLLNPHLDAFGHIHDQ